MVHIFFHRNCADGISAAWIASKLFPDSICYPVDYNVPLPTIPAGDDLLIVDFSLPTFAAYQQMIAHCGSVTVIDHHNSAKNLLREVALEYNDGIIRHTDRSYELSVGDDVTTVFSKELAGGLLTFRYFTDSLPPEMEFPKYEHILALLETISDRDTWKFNLEHSKAFHEAFCDAGLTFEFLDNCMEPDYFKHAVAHGEQLLAPWIAEYMPYAETSLETRYGAEFGPYRIVKVPNKKYLSDVNDAVLRQDPDSVAIAWYADGDNIHYRVNTAPTRPDAMKIAALFGGGGHEHAAGFNATVAEHAAGDIGTIVRSSSWSAS